MPEYCSVSDLYDFGLPRGALPNSARLAKSALASTDQITLNEHGFSLNDPVTFRADQGAGSALPTPLAAGTEYYAIPDTESAFRVAATVDGSAVDLTADGTRVLVITRLPYAATIRGVSALIDDMLPAHVVPLTSPYPEIIRMTCAELSTWKLQARQGARSETFSEITKEARIRLQRWAQGIPIRGTNAPTSAGLAARRAAPRADVKGWSKYGGIA